MSGPQQSLGLRTQPCCRASRACSSETAEPLCALKPPLSPFCLGWFLVTACRTDAGHFCGWTCMQGHRVMGFYEASMLLGNACSFKCQQSVPLILA